MAIDPTTTNATTTMSIINCFKCSNPITGKIFHVGFDEDDNSIIITTCDSEIMCMNLCLSSTEDVFDALCESCALKEAAILMPMLINPNAF